MALFSVNRYYGEDESSEQSTLLFEKRACSILERIHEQARKRTLDAEQQGKSGTESDGSAAQSLPKRKRKRGSTLPQNGASLEETVERTWQRKKKKREEPGAGKDEASFQEENSSEKKAKAPKVKQKQSLEATEVKEAGAELDSDDCMQVDGEPSQSIDNGGKDPEVESSAQDRAEVFTVLGDIQQKQVPKVHRVLPEWLAAPTVISADIRKNSSPLADLNDTLDKDLVEKLRQQDISSFFPAQRQVIPAVIRGAKTKCLAGYRPSDICCSAPTGSGKTLAYVLPIVQVLRQRVVCRIRALVIVPVRDLATQVYRVFNTYCQGTGLKVGLLTGQKTFATEQQSIVKKGLRGFHSLVDIVVATPGRLVDHISQTAGFELGHLRFLVIDEADRMMEDIKHDWLALLESAVYTGCRARPGLLTAAQCRSHGIPLQKLLFSATLSQNPEKLHQLNLFQPKLFTSVITSHASTPDSPKKVRPGTGADADLTEATTEPTGEFVGKYTTPSGLTEYYIQSTANEKPLLVLHLLHHLKFKHVLCFTNSVEAAHRLQWLVKLFGGVEVHEFSSKLHAQKRNRLLRRFSTGKIDLLICSDAMARGMDVENVQYVVSYEMPPFLKTYIHRIGRTARAGRVGTSVTLLQEKQTSRFKKMLKEAGKTGDATELKVKPSQLDGLVDRYKTALKQIPDILKREKAKRSWQ